MKIIPGKGQCTVSNQNNIPTITDNQVANVRRAAIEQRAVWAAMFYLEAKADGIDLEPIMRRAIHKIGFASGKQELEDLGGQVTAGQYARYFAARGVPESSEKKLVEDGEAESRVHLCYCPLLTAWRKLGLDDETCALLCDIAMEGDRGTAEALGLDLELGDTLAKGGCCCQLCFRNKQGITPGEANT